MEYEKMLERAYATLPEKALEKERFELPVASIQMEGNKTIIVNFKEICDTLRREPQHLLKVITKELAVPGNLDGSRLILKTRAPQRVLYEKISNYVKEFVLCKQCKKHDTHLVEKEGITTLVCEVCGARSPVRELK
ncbi:MAG TPA: translation initiation factor IF-2 subunit beta [archaeon]|nr:translation initiation factor IF-2 subunit beta [archaeon]HLD80418.1 translation initiation factor IF-2 subunit beta [archaeon]